MPTVVGKVIRIVCGLWLLGIAFNEVSSLTLHHVQAMAAARAEVQAEKEAAIARPVTVRADYLSTGQDPWSRKIGGGANGGATVTPQDRATQEGWGPGQVLPDSAFATR